MAWKKIVGGTWQVPLELAKAEILQYEFNAYRRKYQESGVLSHEAKALEFDVNGLLGGWCDLVGKITCGVKAVTMREGEINSDRDTSIYSSTRASLELGLEGSGYEERFNRSEYPTFDCSFSASSFGHEESERFDYGFSEIDECSKLLNVDLSRIPEEQRYLKVTPSDNDDSVKLETINGKEYFVKLKELELNEGGEFVMTLRVAQNTAFLERGTEELLIKKISTSHVNCAELLPQEPQIQKGFIKIDNALSSIFNNINCNKT